MAENLEREVYVCEANLVPGEMRGQKVEGQWILIVNYQGTYHALDASCAHSGYPLHKGKLDEKGVLTCALHYAQFDCGTGKVVSVPAICDDQPVFKIALRDGKVYWLRPC